MENEEAEGVADEALEAEATGEAAEGDALGEVTHDPAGPTDHSPAVDPSADATGLPQLDISTFDNQIFWLAVALLAIYLILTRIALPRIGAVLAERQGSITNDIAAAEDLKRQAAEAEKAYEKALADARAEAQAISDQARAEIQADLNEAIAAADARIAEQTAQSEARIGEIRDGAAQSVEEVARDTAAEIVRALGTAGDVDEAAIRQAVNARTGGAA